MKKLKTIAVIGALMSIPPWGITPLFGWPGCFVQIIGLMLSILALILIKRKLKTF
jgi:hypothetical protein